MTDALSGLALGFGNALSLANLGWALLGCFLGTAVGVLPGIGPALTVALLLPITFKVGATGAFILFCGVYYGAMYGGSTTSILLNTPGESGSIITALEGAKMARSGRAGPALATARPSAPSSPARSARSASPFSARSGWISLCNWGRRSTSR